MKLPVQPAALAIPTPRALHPGSLRPGSEPACTGPAGLARPFVHREMEQHQPA